VRLAVDTGGTFTDAVTSDGEVLKVVSTPDDPASAVRRVVAHTGAVQALAHGTTVATNALLERRGGRVALIVTEGHRDVIEIARQVRPSLYDPAVTRVEPLVPRQLRFEIAGRLDSSGKELTALGPVPSIPTGVDAVAVCLLHADLDPRHEEEVAASMRGHEVVLSSRVSPEHREYERMVTTVADAYLRRPCASYLASLEALAKRSSS
jgi:N-methylhydantoinase A/oxoprolinase/acetone carboxylase beta subunit